MNLSPKLIRKIEYQLRVLAKDAAYSADTLEEARRLGDEYLKRLIRLNDGGSVLLSDVGMSALQTVCEILNSAELVPKTKRTDAVVAFRKLHKEWLSRKETLLDGEDLVSKLSGILEESRDNFWHVVPMHGVELHDVSSLDLECLTLMPASKEALELHGAVLDGSFSAEAMLGSGPCLFGSAYGSEGFARQEFKFRTEYVTGVVAAVGAVCYRDGAMPFRITSEVTVTGARAAARGASWRDNRRSIVWRRNVLEHQSLVIDRSLASFIESTGYVRCALGLVTKSDSSDLEQALIRGIFWFSDAQRDGTPVMQLVKYWSCAEAVFSVKGEAITKSVCEGVAAILVSGVRAEPSSNYSSVLARLNDLYELRSRAVHDARHDHVAYEDVATLSRWMGWVLLGVAGLIHEKGYTSVRQVQEQSTRLAGFFRQKKFEGPASPSESEV